MPGGIRLLQIAQTSSRGLFAIPVSRHRCVRQPLRARVVPGGEALRVKPNRPIAAQVDLVLSIGGGDRPVAGVALPSVAVAGPQLPSAVGRDGQRAGCDLGADVSRKVLHQEDTVLTPAPQRYGENPERLVREILSQVTARDARRRPLRLGGFAAYFEKPLDLDNVCEKIRTIMRPASTAAPPPGA